MDYSRSWQPNPGPIPQALTCLGLFFVKLPQNRHPERSASQIDRVTQRLWRGVEGPRRAYFTHAVRSFSTTEPHRAGPQRLAAREEAQPHWQDRSRVQRPCAEFGMEDDYSAEKDVPVTIKCVSQHILLSGFGGRKARRSTGKISTPRSFDSAPQALCHAINLSGAPLRMTILWEFDEKQS
jgi:hypothetical protein